MAFKHSTNKLFTTKYGEPYIWGSGDVTTTPSTENKITASDADVEDRFGESVAVGNGRIVVGAPGDDGNGGGQGSAYIYNLDRTNETKITASDGAGGDQFGSSVAVGSGRIVVAAPSDDSGRGAAYIFDFNGTQLAKITASDAAEYDFFGRSVAVGNNRIVVGATGDDDDGFASGSAYIYDLDGTQLAKITASDGAAYDNFGSGVAVGCGRIVVGSPGDDDNGSDSGSAYIFDLDGTQLAKITASDAAGGEYFGNKVAIGNGRIVVGSPQDDDNGSFSGSAYIFDLDGTQLAKITASDGAADDYFGREVAVGSGRIVVGAYGDDDNGNTSGSAYIFDLDGNQLAKITASDGAGGDQFGTSVAVGSGRIVVGAPRDDDDDNGFDSGSAYIYETPRVYTPYDLIYNEV